jgi:uncharacterized protein YjbK
VRIIEQELKFCVNEQDFYKFKRLLDNSSNKIVDFTQINYYIDTPNLDLNKRQISLRIRDYLNNRCELTLKVPIKDALHLEHASSKDEETLELYNIDVEAILTNGISSNNTILNFIYKRLGSLINIDSLQIIGKLETYRELYQIGNIDDLLNIDINKYFDVQDYEIEWECCDLAKCSNLILGIFKQLSINYNKNALHKNDRFVEKLNKA